MHLLTLFIFCVLSICYVTTKRIEVSNTSYPFRLSSKSILCSGLSWNNFSFPFGRNLRSLWISSWSSWNSCSSWPRSYESPWRSWSKNSVANTGSEKRLSGIELFLLIVGIVGIFAFCLCLDPCWCDDPESGDAETHGPTETHSRAETLGLTETLSRTDNPESQLLQSSTSGTNPSQTLRSNETDTHATYHNGLNVRHAVNTSAIGSLMDDYVTSRYHPTSSDAGHAFSSLPLRQTSPPPVSTAVHPTTSTNQDEYRIPTITSLIEDYIGIRNRSISTASSDEGLSDGYPVPASAPLLEEYNDTGYSRRSSAPPVTSSEEPSEDAPPSYESLFGEK